MRSSRWTYGRIVAATMILGAAVALAWLYPESPVASEPPEGIPSDGLAPPNSPPSTPLALRIPPSDASLETLFAELEVAGVQGRREQGELIADRIIAFGGEAARHPREVFLDRESLYLAEGIYKYLLIRVIQGIASPAVSEILFEALGCLDAESSVDINDTQFHALRVMIPVIALHRTPVVRDGALRLFLSTQKPRLKRQILALVKAFGVPDPEFADAIRPLLNEGGDSLRLGAIEALGVAGDMTDIAGFALHLSALVAATDNQDNQENYELAKAIAHRVGPEAFLGMIAEAIPQSTRVFNLTGAASAAAQAAKDHGVEDWTFALNLVSPEAHRMQQLLGLQIINNAFSAGALSGPDVDLMLETLYASTPDDFVRANVLVAVANRPDEEQFERIYRMAASRGGRLEEEAYASLTFYLERYPESGRARALAAELLATPDTSRKISFLYAMRLESNGAGLAGTDPYREILKQTAAENPDPEARLMAQRILEENSLYLRRLGH